MSQNRLPASDRPLAEAPSQDAELIVSVSPVQRRVTIWGRVPPGQARGLIAMLGILASTITGISGVVLTLRIEPGLTVLAYAELALALVAIVLIAACGKPPGNGEDRGQGITGNRRTGRRSS
jgi:hypothetical protein